MVIIIGSPKPIIVSRASETHCGPAKIYFGWPDWPAREKVKHDPCVGYVEFSKVKMFPVRKRVEQLKMNHMFNIVHGISPAYLKETYHCK